jgi:hypothetical protein
VRHVFQILAQFTWNTLEPIDPVGSCLQVVGQLGIYH